MIVPDQCPCPICGQSSDRMQSLSESSIYVDYFRCVVCGHIWTVAKGECDPQDHITTKTT